MTEQEIQRIEGGISKLVERMDEVYAIVTRQKYSTVKKQIHLERSLGDLARLFDGIEDTSTLEALKILHPKVPDMWDLIAEKRKAYRYLLLLGFEKYRTPVSLDSSRRERFRRVRSSK